MPLPTFAPVAGPSNHANQAAPVAPPPSVIGKRPPSERPDVDNPVAKKARQDPDVHKGQDELEQRFFQGTLLLKIGHQTYIV